LTCPGGCLPFRKGLVTPSGSLTGETEPAQGGVFVDWLTISQTHPEGGLPLVDAGCVVGMDEDGLIEWKTARAKQHAGSFETSINVRCDGNRVTVSGNASRFGRADNLFGFDFPTCLERFNAILASYGLPAFTPGVGGPQYDEQRHAWKWTGARVSRIDLTRNFCAGNPADAHALMQWLGSQHAGRKTGRVLGQGETVDFGGGQREYFKAYLKWLEMRRHGGDERAAQWAEEQGLVRVELTLRSKKLTDLGAAYLGDYLKGDAMGTLINLFNERASLLSRATRSTDDLDELPRHLRATARDFIAGMDCARVMSRATFFRHRRELLPYGIDIAVRNVRPFTPRVRVVELCAAEIPPWYQLNAA